MVFAMLNLPPTVRHAVILLQLTSRIIRVHDSPSFDSRHWMETWYTLALAIQRHLEINSLIATNRLCQPCKQECVVVVLREC